MPVSTATPGASATVSLPPVGGDSIGGPRQPLFVATQAFKDFCRKELGTVSGRMPKRLQEPCAGKNPYLVKLKSKEPGGLFRIEPRGGDFPAQELGLLGIHDAILVQLPSWNGVPNTQESSPSRFRDSDEERRMPRSAEELTQFLQ
ncbi:MAG: hypothetical protein J0L84_20740 [Verrucomicrobia bacterium]|nr:hypothetical protein [Verrucomicrobiota bacterium]